MAAFPRLHSHANRFALSDYLYPMAPRCQSDAEVGYFQGVYTQTPMHIRYMPPSYFVPYHSGQDYLHPMATARGYAHGVYTPTQIYSGYMVHMNFISHQPHYFTSTMNPRGEQGNYNNQFIVPIDDSWILQGEEVSPQWGTLDDSLILNAHEEQNSMISEELRRLNYAREGEEESTLTWGSIDEEPNSEDTWILNDEPENERYRRTLEELFPRDLAHREAMVSDGLSEEIISKYLNSGNRNPLVNAADICVVCQDSLFQINEPIATLDCGHGFHAGCIKTWLIVKNCCPLCKATGIRL